MSKAFTTNPTRTVPRGRGRGQPARAGTRNVVPRNQQPNHNTRPAMQDELESSGGGRQPPSSEDASDRMQRKDAYTVIAPNPEKRQTIAANARREEENYQRHKEQKKLGAVSYVGTAGRGVISEDKSRQRTANQLKQAAFNVRQKSQQYREETRRKENEKYGKVKDHQRNKSEQNERRDSARQRDLKEDHRRRNEAFLQRIERENQQKQSEKILSTSAATAYDSSNIYHNSSPVHTGDLSRLQSQSDLEEPEDDGEKFPKSLYSRDASDTDLYNRQSSYHTDKPVYRQGVTQAVSSSETLSHDRHGYEESEEGASVYTNPVDVLHQEYPGVDVDVLESLLLQCNGRVEKVRDLIGS